MSEEELKERVRLLEGLLHDAVEAINHGDFSNGICCCGSSVGSHGFGDGHSPVDSGDYYILSLKERINDAMFGPAIDEEERIK